MAIPINLNAINKRLSEMKTKDKQISYLSEYLFSFQKKRAEMEIDKNTLSHLREKTDSDYKKYMDEFERGGLIYFNDDKSDIVTYKRLGFENIPLLKKRLSIENTFMFLESDISLLKDLIEKTKHAPAIPEKTLSLKSNLSKKQIEKLFELLFPNYLLTNIKTFESIFTDEITPLKKPITWNKSTRLLAYFFNSKIINSIEWQSVIEKGNLFLNRKGKKITASDLATALNYIKTVESPKGHKEIDSIISELKKL